MQNRKLDPPDYCKATSNNVFARNWEPPPQKRDGGWGVDIYDPKTGKFEAIDLCFVIHHLKMAYDKDETVYFAMKIGQVGGVGWVNSRVWDETHDAEKAQGWCPPVIDYNGDGKIGAYTRAPQPPDPKLDQICRRNTRVWDFSESCRWERVGRNNQAHAWEAPSLCSRDEPAFDLHDRNL